jgi:hypothetical protein
MKNMLKWTLVASLILVPFVATMAAKGDKPAAAAKKADAPAAEMKEFTVKGTLSVETKTRKAGKETKIYTVTPTEGSAASFIEKAVEGGVAADLLTQKVTVTGKGRETDHKGTKIIRLRKVESLKKVEG